VQVAEDIEAGLIVMGSVSDSVVRHAHCPVMIVRRDFWEATMDKT
jgi:nucleotide-binding universal stress UspA family protein